MIPRLFAGFPHRLSEGCMPQLGLLAFKGNENGMVSVLVGHVHGFGWCIVVGWNNGGDDGCGGGGMMVTIVEMKWGMTVF